MLQRLPTASTPSPSSVGSGPERPGERLDVVAERGRARGLPGRPREPERADQPLVDEVGERRARQRARRPRRAARRRGSSSASARRPEHELGLREAVDQLGAARELERLPDLAGRLALEAGAVREQPADRRGRRSAPPGRAARAGRRASSFPSSRRSITAAAVNVFVDRADAVLRVGRRVDAVSRRRCRPPPPRRPRRRGRRLPRRSVGGARTCPRAQDLASACSGGCKDAERPAG